MRISLAEAVARLRSGELVGMPTETVYGLAADARNESAVRKVFAAKGRPADHPLILHVADAHAARDVSRWDPRADALLDLWPGPLTLVMPRRGVLDVVTGGHDTVALRVPAHAVALSLLAGVGPLAAPSANRFGRVSPTRAEHLEAEFDDVPVLDGGPCTVGVESTIVAFVGGAPRLLRPGAVTLDLLLERLGPVEVGGTVAAPGTLPSHYAPRGRVVLVPAYTPGADVPTLPPEEHARTLYDALRACDDRGLDPIVCALAEPVGIGVAVNDRLARAARRG